VDTATADQVSGATRWLLRATLSAAAFVCTWMLCSGTASAAEQDPRVPLVDSVVDSAAPLTRPVGTTVRHTLRTVSEPVRPVVEETVAEVAEVARPALAPVRPVLAAVDRTVVQPTGELLEELQPVTDLATPVVDVAHDLVEPVTDAVTAPVAPVPAPAEPSATGPDEAAAPSELAPLAGPPAPGSRMTLSDDLHAPDRADGADAQTAPALALDAPRDVDTERPTTGGGPAAATPPCAASGGHHLSTGDAGDLHGHIRPVHDPDSSVLRDRTANALSAERQQPGFSPD
jgi:hypothetical protein